VPCTCDRRLSQRVVLACTLAPCPTSRGNGLHYKARVYQSYPPIVSVSLGTANRQCCMPRESVVCYRPCMLPRHAHSTACRVPTSTLICTCVPPCAWFLPLKARVGTFVHRSCRVSCNFSDHMLHLGSRSCRRAATPLRPSHVPNRYCRGQGPLYVRAWCCGPPALRRCTAGAAEAPGGPRHRLACLS
jgi:hypothetical protein